MVHFYFSLPVALRAVAGVARRLATILTLIARSFSNQNVYQGRVNWILTFFRSVAFRACRRRHLKSSFAPQFGGDLTNTIAKMVGPKEDRVPRRLAQTRPERTNLGKSFDWG
jgi:hypothetical protein